MSTEAWVRLSNPSRWTRFKMWWRTLIPIPTDKKPMWIKDARPVINIYGYFISFVPILSDDGFTVCISVRMSIGQPFSRSYEIHRAYFYKHWTENHLCFFETKDFIYVVHVRDLIGFVF